MKIGEIERNLILLGSNQMIDLVNEKNSFKHD